MARGRPRNEDRLDSIALGLPTYTGKVHPACGTAERYIRGACVACSTAAKSATMAKRQERAAQQSPFKGMGSGCRSKGRPRVLARVEALAQGQPTYTGKVHAKCGTAVRYTGTVKFAGACVACQRARFATSGYYEERDAKIARKQAEAMIAPAREPLVFEGPRPTRFFTGIPCKHGHVVERLISSGGCVECMNTRNNATRKTQAYRDKTNAKNAAKRGMALEDVKPRGAKPWSASARTRFAARFRKAPPTVVDIEALAVGRALAEEARAISRLVNADAYKKRMRRGNVREASRRIEAMAVARMMIPDTLKSVKGYSNKVKTALDFVKMIGAQHPSENTHVPL